MVECGMDGCRRPIAYRRSKFGMSLCAPCYQRKYRDHINKTQRPDCSMFVYFVQSHDGYIKIGRANDVDKRIANLQVGQPHRLRTLLILSGRSSLEFELHARFAHLRVRDDGEWFVAGRELLDFIANPCMPTVHMVEEADPQLELEL